MRIALFYPALHTLRGFAALWVVLYHAWVFSGFADLLAAPFLSVGWLGVHLFYALSAFLLGLHFFRSEEKGWSYRAFMIRRSLRIFPAYYAQLVILLVAAWALGFGRLPSPADGLAHLFMYFHLPPNFVQPLNGVWWTLPVEFMFYLLLPLLAVLLKRIGWLPFLGLALALTVAYRVAVFAAMQDGPVTAMANEMGQLPGQLTVFACGLIAARFTAAGRYPKRTRHWIAAGLALASAAWVAVLLGSLEDYWQGHALLWLWESGNAPLFAGVIFALHSLTPHSGWLTHRLGVWLGDISYGIYLWHLPLILAVNGLLPAQLKADPRFWTLLGLALPLTLAVAAASYYLLERPAIRLGRRWSARYHSRP